MPEIGTEEQYRTADAIIAKALQELGFSEETEVDLTITDDETIRQINREYRQIDRATDVLSFPLNSPEDVAQGRFEHDPETGHIMLGDIVISYPTMLRQAEEYGHGVEREFTYLLIHSLLHLIGYDHMQEDEKAVMRAMEEKVYSRITDNGQSATDQ